jgi:hypothetical protein
LDPAQLDARAASLRLQDLYGEDCLPSDLLAVFNVGFVGLRHAGTDGIESVRRQFYLVLYKYIVLIDEHPVATRFFTFAQCVWALTRLALLGLPIDIYSVLTIKPNQTFAKRLTAVKRYWAKAHTPMELRRSSICLRLSHLVMSITGQKARRPDPVANVAPAVDTPTLPSSDSVAIPKRGPRIAFATADDTPTQPRSDPSKRFPLAVRLGNGEILSRACGMFLELLSKLRHDPFLHNDHEQGVGSSKLAEVIVALLTTLVHIIMRFQRYRQYPSAIQALCKTFNPDTYQDGCHAFLLCDHRDLDEGYALPLFRDAWRGRSEVEALEYLLSDPIQEELTDLLWASDASTLDVERKHFRDKRSERAGKKVTSVPSCQNNKYLLRFIVRVGNQYGCVIF